MLSFKDYIDDLRTDHKHNNVWGTEPNPYVMYNAYVLWLKAKAQAQDTTLEEDKLFTHLLVQIRIISDYSAQLSSAEGQSLPEVQIDEETIFAYQQQIVPMIETWVRSVDKQLYGYVSAELDMWQHIAILALLGTAAFALTATLAGTSVYFYQIHAMHDFVFMLTIASVIAATATIMAFAFCSLDDRSHLQPSPIDTLWTRENNDHEQEMYQERLRAALHTHEHRTVRQPIYHDPGYLTDRFSTKRESIDYFMQALSGKKRGYFTPTAKIPALDTFVENIAGSTIANTHTPAEFESDAHNIPLIPTASERTKAQQATLQSIREETINLLTFRYKTPYTDKVSYHQGKPTQRLNKDHNGPIKFSVNRASKV